jgi:hypothetical protein
MGRGEAGAAAAALGMEDRAEMSARTLIKNMLGELPYTAELYWLLRHRDQKVHTRFNLDVLNSRLPAMLEQVAPFAQAAPKGKKIFYFASLHFWIKHAAATSLALSGLGHEVRLGYLAYSDYDKPIQRFDLRRHDLYARSVLEKMQPYVQPLSFLDLKAASLPPELARKVEQVGLLDTQYTLQKEEVTGEEPIYLLRQERNQEAARKAMAAFQAQRPDVVTIPNGMIQEFGAVYETARFLEIPVVTYEFGEQNKRTWIGHNQKVMYFEGVDELWATRKDRILNEGQRNWLENFLLGRQKVQAGEKFAHLWQRTDRQGGEKIRQALGLDDRPLVILPTNVLGDSATLGRTIFTRSMSQWIEKILPVMAQKPQVQWLVRIHPAEASSVGPSVGDIIRKVLPDLPSHIHLIGPTEKVNTYDLMELADLALVYTTNAGLEIATRGIPVLVSGQAHYRSRGFTLDADTWDEYLARLDQALSDLPGHRLTPEQLERAWNFAYTFYCEYPQPFPWHIEKLGTHLDNSPLSYVLGPKGQAEFGPALREFAGGPLSWA